MKIKRLIVFFTAGLCAASSVFPQNSENTQVKISYSGNGNYTLVERSDLRRYDNGKYTGLVSREVKSFICQTQSPLAKDEGDRFYDGNFYVNEKTKHDNLSVKKGLHVSIPSQFIIQSDGDLIMIQDNGYPTFRSFPAFMKEEISKGAKWSANAIRSVDPLNKGTFTKIPMLVEYTYLNDDVFNGEEVFVLSARWATRYYPDVYDENGDAELIKAAGSHKATMNVSKRTGNALVIRDQVDETFFYADGNQVNFKGTISLFTEYPPSVDSKALVETLRRAKIISDEQAAVLTSEWLPAKKPEPKPASSSEKPAPASTTPASDAKPAPAETPAPEAAAASKNVAAESAKPAPEPKPVPPVVTAKDIDISKTDAGVMLSIKNLQFKSDSAELLAGEEKRLDEIAAILKTLPKNMFLVEGHTADTGFAKGEMALSKERALTIAEALSRRGIDSSRFICKGSGALKPIADNSTPEGKARNRRVEITILE